MIRLAHTGDLHFDERNRLDDRCRVMRAFVESARDCEVDIILVAGDVFERRSTAVERLAVAQFLADAAEVAPVVLVRGNHDLPGEVRIFERLSVGIHVADLRMESFKIRSGAWGHHVRDDGAHVTAVPWFDKSRIVAQAAIRDTGEATRQTIEAARALLDTIRIDCAEARSKGYVPLVVAHTMIGGSTVSTGQVILGQTVEQAPAEWAETGASYVALGHVHKRQEWYGGRVSYSGSPDRMNFGEPEEKGWNLVTIADDGHFQSNQFMPLPARKMVLLDTDDIGAYEASADVDGALVRVRVRCTPADLAALTAGGYGSALQQFHDALKEAGAHHVKIEPVVEAVTRARVPEITTARSTWEKLELYLDAKGVDVDRDSLRRRLEDLEGGALLGAKTEGGVS